MRGLLCLCFMAAAQAVAAAPWATPADFEAAMDAALRHENILVDASFTNSLATFMSAPLDADSRTCAELVWSVSRQTAFDRRAEFVLPDAFAAASNCLAHADSSDWKFWAAQLQLFSCHVAEEAWPAAYLTASNAVDSLSASAFQDSSNRVARAFLANNKIESLSFREAVMFAKAVSAAEVGKTDEALALCSGLPQSCSNEVAVLVSEHNTTD